MSEDKQTMYPYSDRIVFRQIELEYKSAGGLILGQIEGDREVMYGRVVAVGAGKETDQRLIPIKTKVGDIIVVGQRIPTKLNVKGLDYFTVNEHNLIMKFDDQELIEKEFHTEGMELTVQGNARVLN